MNESPFRQAIREIVRKEITELMGFQIGQEDNEAPSRASPRRRRKSTLRNSGVMAKTSPSRKGTTYGAGKGAVSNPKTDKRLKKNRSEEE